MEYQTIRYELRDAVALITLNRPERLNAWTPRMAQEQADAIERANADPAVGAIVMTGAGRGFCAGADMGGLQAIGATGAASDRTTRAEPVPAGGSARPDFRMTYSYFPSIPKPIIAAINGPCAGLGLIMALYCDMRFAAENAVFTTAFAARGLIAEHGISWLLPKLVGMPHAMDLLLSARKIRAPEALAMGMVNRVIADATLLAETRTYARLLAETVSPRSTAVMKRQLWDAQFQTLAEATAVANHDMELSFASADFKEGVAHYVEKRAPRFTGG
jgi:enoyl-CoA hydratase/carnithine racemase